MRDIDLFTKLLALERPWTVSNVILEAMDESVHVLLDHRSNARFHCPECDAVLPLHDHSPLRQWRHLDHGSWLTWVHARIPRVACPVHGVRQVRLPWALPGSRLTVVFERQAINTLLGADVLGASRLPRLSWHETWGVMERAVARGLAAKRRRVIPRLGVDEKAVAERHRYVTLVSDLDRGTIEYIAFDRKTSSLDELVLPVALLDATGGHPGRGHGHVGTVHRGDAAARARRRQQDCLRPIPHHEAHGRCRGCGAAVGASTTAGGGATTPSSGPVICGCSRRRTSPRSRPSGSPV